MREVASAEITNCPASRIIYATSNCSAVLEDLTGELETSTPAAVESVEQSPEIGASLGLGEHQVVFTVTYTNEAVESCTNLLTVLDTTPPALACGANKNVECGSAWTFDEPVALDACSGTNVTLTVLNTATNGLILTRTWAADDATGNTNTCSQSVTLVDTMAPIVLGGPPNLTLIAGLSCTAVIPDLTAQLAVADCSAYDITQNPAAGAELGVGDYPLTFRIRDTASNATTFVRSLIVIPPAGAATNISISEFMAKNTFTLADENGDYSDWIEIHNAGSCPLNLKDWSLTDNATQLTKWRFPATNIASGQFLVVWASNKNRRTPGKPLHTNFKLADEGEYLALVRPDGVTIATQFAPTFPAQLPDVSYGLPTDSPTNSYLAWPTPGFLNSPGTNFIVANLEFNPGRGWFTNFVSVSIGTPTPGVTIYFTTNGTVPSPTNGFVYSSPLAFSSTTGLRAAAYRPGYVPSIATHTYVFPKVVASQTGTGFPTHWGLTTLGDGTTNLFPVPAYYACNSNLVNDPRWGAQMPRALLSLPTLSVVMNPDDMFGTNGIYSNPLGSSVAWERPCSVEYFRPDSRPGFQINCGIRLEGEMSRDPTVTPKHNLRLLFKQVYGAAPLVFDLYPGSPVREFNSLVMHASFGDHWFYGVATAQMHRDQWCADTLSPGTRNRVSMSSGFFARNTPTWTTQSSV